MYILNPDEQPGENEDTATPLAAKNCKNLKGPTENGSRPHNEK
jgi:hypothetical protein